MYAKHHTAHKSCETRSLLQQGAVRQTCFARTRRFWLLHVAPLLVFLSHMVTSKVLESAWYFVSIIAFRKYNSIAAIPGSRGDWVWLVGSISMHQSSNSICYRSSVQQFNFPNGKHQLWRLPNPICFEIALRWPSNKVESCVSNSASVPEKCRILKSRQSCKVRIHNCV